MAGHRLYGKTDYMIDNRHTTSQSGQILTRQHFILLVYTILCIHNTVPEVPVIRFYPFYRINSVTRNPFRISSVTRDYTVLGVN